VRLTDWPNHGNPSRDEALVAGTKAGWYDDGTGTGRSAGGTARGMNYVVLQVVLKEKLWGTGSGNLTELEKAINAQAALGYRLHTISTATSGSKGIGGGDRIQATMAFERLE
jgi:hypothetical protein